MMELVVYNLSTMKDSSKIRTAGKVSISSGKMILFLIRLNIILRRNIELVLGEI